MKNKVIFTQLTAEELQQLVGDEFKKAFQGVQFSNQSQQPRIGGVELAEEITGYTRSSVYTMVSRGKIPHFKRDGRLLFNEEKLRSWLTEKDDVKKVDYEQEFEQKLRKIRGND